MVQTWDPVIATLPDLSVMVSKTYVNEVDISFIEVGLSTNISFDAFPDKKLTGKVIQIANVGEQKPNSDSKVFEVLIELNESDTTMRPGMGHRKPASRFRARSRRRRQQLAQP